MQVHYPKLYNMAHLLASNILQLPKDLTIIFIYLAGYIYFRAHFGCYHILILVRSSIKWRQYPDMTIAVDWDA